MVIPTLAMNLDGAESAPKRGWEQLLDMHMSELKFSMSSGDYSYFTSLRLQHAQSKVDQSAVLAAIAPQAGNDVNKKLSQLNVDVCKVHQTAFEAIQNTILSITSDPNAANAKPDWEKKIDDQAAAQKAQVNAAIDDAANRAKLEIEKLPDAARPAAADVFVTGANYVAGVLNTFMNAIKSVLGKVADFVVGIFNSVTDAYNSVKGAVSGAINAIGGLFGGIFEKLSGAPMTNGTPEGSYAGPLAWPSSIKLTAASRALGYVQDILSDKGYEITDGEIKKDKSAVSSKTVFSPSNGTASAEQLKRVWDEVVGSLGNDGHYIPYYPSQQIVHAF
ncbi:hypothetical protein N7486_000539 [Penicillium sp. IBT 16267x]|nr:hypothetical protein N7486_000539 [Penicillium sp. IBT 16267x]